MSDPGNDLFATAQRLQQQGEPYALVSVVRTQAPSSARAGDKALVTAQGIVHGWIGGGCTQPAVLHTVRRALQDGRARLIRVAPAGLEASSGATPAADGTVEVGMSCHSGGTIELFVDPILPPTRLVVIGDSPVAVALAGLAPRVGLPVTVIAHGADPRRFADAGQVIDGDEPAMIAGQVTAGGWVVVATQGRRDLSGLRVALSLQAAKIWLVASARKAQALRELLLAAKYDPQAVSAIIAPAGQPIGAQTPEEIALSVLAAVVAARRAGRAVLDAAVPAAAPPAEAQVETAPKCCGH